MSKKYFYAVVGENAVMVADTYERGKFCMDKYFRGHRYIKKFGNFEEAEEYALWHFSTHVPLYACPKGLKLNQVVTVQKVLGLDGGNGYFDQEKGGKIGQVAPRKAKNNAAEES